MYVPAIYHLFWLKSNRPLDYMMQPDRNDSYSGKCIPLQGDKIRSYSPSLELAFSLAGVFRLPIEEILYI